MKRPIHYALYLILVSIYLSYSALPAFTAKAAEESSPKRMEEITKDRPPWREGFIPGPEEIYIDSFVGYKDYKYPKPEGEVGVTLYCGHHQISTRGQEEIIQIGIQGMEVGFEELPVMNLAFVIDKSSTMSGWKMEWAKEAFEIFINRVREKDRVALVVFDGRAEVLVPSTRVSGQAVRERFIEALEGVTAGGSKDMAAGLRKGYAQVLSGYDEEYVNRVLFLSDGRGGGDELLEMARAHSAIGINLTTLGIGTSFNLKLMRDLAHMGGGSSRFISDRGEEMEKIFGSELDRTVVPVARDLEMKLEFEEDVEILGTWGYENRVEGKSIYYHAPTLHNRDYETILVQVRTKERWSTGEGELAKFSLEYSDMGGGRHTLGPYTLKAEFVDMELPVTGFSDAMVLRSGTMLHFAEKLKQLGEIYYSDDVFGQRPVWEKQGEERDLYEELTGPQIRDLIEYEYPNLKRMIDMTVGMKKEILDARRRLGDKEFEVEIRVLNNYIDILGEDLKLDYQERVEYAREEEIAPPVEGRSLSENIANLVREMSLDLRDKGEEIVVASGGGVGEGSGSELVELIKGMAEEEFSGLENVNLVGENESANYMVTGSVIKTEVSVVIFARIINLETKRIESAAQVILSRGGEVEALL